MVSYHWRTTRSYARKPPYDCFGTVLLDRVGRIDVGTAGAKADRCIRVDRALAKASNAIARTLILSILSGPNTYLGHFD